jgi:hypothetical protein
VNWKDVAVVPLDRRSGADRRENPRLASPGRRYDDEQRLAEYLQEVWMRERGDGRRGTR